MLFCRIFLRKVDSTKNKNLEFDRDFVIRHYAGDVVYNVNGFMEKNKDTLFQDFKRLLFNSKNEVYRYVPHPRKNSFKGLKGSWNGPSGKRNAQSKIVFYSHWTII